MRADVRMIERREHLRFALEPREALGSATNASGRILIATSRFELRVAGAIDLAHAADAEQAVDAEYPDVRADRASLEQSEG